MLLYTVVCFVATNAEIFFCDHFFVQLLFFIFIFLPELSLKVKAQVKLK